MWKATILPLRWATAKEQICDVDGKAEKLWVEQDEKGREKFITFTKEVPLLLTRSNFVRKVRWMWIEGKKEFLVNWIKAREWWLCVIGRLVLLSLSIRKYFMHHPEWNVCIRSQEGKWNMRHAYEIFTIYPLPGINSDHLKFYQIIT